MNFSEFSKQDSGFVHSSGRLYRRLFYVLPILYFVSVGFLTLTSSGRRIAATASVIVPSSVADQISMLNEMGLQFGAAYLVQVVLFLTLPPIFAANLVRASTGLIISAKRINHEFPGIYKQAGSSIALSIAAFAPLLFSGTLAAGEERSITDRAIVWPESFGILLGASFFMTLGLHYAILAVRTASTKEEEDNRGR